MYFWRGGLGSKYTPPVGARGGQVGVLLAGRAGFEIHTPCGCPRRTSWGTSGGEGGIRNTHPLWVPAADKLVYFWRGGLGSKYTPPVGARGRQVGVLLAGRAGFEIHTPCGCPRRTSWCTSGGEGWVRNTHPLWVPAADKLVYFWRGGLGSKYTPPVGARGGQVGVLLAGRAGFEIHTPCGCPRRTSWCTSGGEGWVRNAHPSRVPAADKLVYFWRGGRDSNPRRRF